MAEPQKYRKKAVEIEAMEWPGGQESAREIVEWVRQGGYAQYDPRQHFVGERITIATLEGPITASPGDFIIRGTKGEFYPCKPDIFRSLHEMPSESVEDLLAEVDQREKTADEIFGGTQPFVIDADTGRWAPGQELSHPQAVRIAASVLPGINEEQVAQFYDTTLFDSGPKQ